MRKLSITLGLFTTLVAATVWAGKVDTWRQSTSADFEKGKTKQTVISDRGQIRLSRELQPFGELAASFVWDLVEDKDGNVFAATGDEGKIFKITPDGKASLVYDADDQHIFTLALAPDGILYAGTAPGGLVLKIADGKAATHYKTGKNYVWKLLLAPDGVLYAATGTKAEVFKINPDGTGSSLYSARQNHMLSLALAPDGHIYAGCDGDGLVYKITPQGRAFVVYDAQQDEIHTLLATADGTLYAGTSSPAQPMPGRPPGGLIPPPQPPGNPSGAAGAFESDVAESSTPVQTGQSTSTRAATEGAQASSTSVQRAQPGQNAVYRIDSDGAVREVFQDRVLIFTLAQQNQRLLVGTGQQGQLFDLDDSNRERSEIAKLDHGVITSMLRRSDGSVLIGTGDPGKLYRLTTDYADKGSFESQVFDAGMISRWGAIRWTADTPDGTKVSFAVRSGNTKTPDDTWTDWSVEQVDAQTASASCPPSRFIQFRATLESSRDDATPTLRAVLVRYMTLNQPPELTKIEIPDVGEGDGSTRQAKLKIKWEAKDPNNDELEFTLFIRKEGWNAWVKLPEKLTKKEFEWDTDSVPDGQYRIRIEAADRSDNPQENVLSTARESSLFIVDHTAPNVEVKAADAKEGEVSMEVRGTDSLTRVVGASYSIDSGPWTKIFPIDQIFDSKSEAFRFSPADLKPGNHVITVRVVDSAGNVGTGDLVFFNR